MHPAWKFRRYWKDFQMSDIIIGLDIGQHTGIAIAEISSKTFNLLASHTFYHHPNNIHPQWWGAVGGADAVVIEYPQPNNFSRDIQKTLVYSNYWRAYLYKVSQKTEVSPGTWKNTRASIWDPLNVLWPKPRKRVPTKHVLDACRIIYWYATSLGLYED